MNRKRNTSHPNFITGLVSYILLIVGVILNANGFITGKPMIVISVVIGGIHWIASIIDIWTDKSLKQEETSRYFWLALAIIVPPVVGMMYYMMNRKRINL